MQPFRKILVDVDATASAHPALDRAIQLARKSGARLTVADAMTGASLASRSLPAGMEESFVQGRRQQLARIARDIDDIRVDAKLLLGRPGTVLIEEVVRSNHDLVVRSHARDLASSGHQPFGEVDMELLRKCPCPVLLVRHGQPATHPRIACAVDAGSEDAGAQELNAKIVELALMMAEYLGSLPPTLFHAWVPFAERTIRSHADGDQFAAYLDGARERAASALTQMARSFDIDEGHTVLRRGEPGDVIPEFVVSEGIDLLVMGTFARGGIPGMVIGNTAERVLRKLPCSVLTVKPDGFVSPVDPETA